MRSKFLIRLSTGIIGLFLIAVASQNLLNIGSTQLASSSEILASLNKECSTPHRFSLRRELSDNANPAVSNSTFSSLPVTFEINCGQFDPCVQFVSRGKGYMFFLTKDEAVLSLQKPSTLDPKKNIRVDATKVSDNAVVRMKLSECNRGVQYKGEGELTERSNYVYGSNPKDWYKNIPHFSKVFSKDVYPGIDLIYYSTDKNLEYDFVVAPGANPKQICMHYEGAEQLKIDSNGALVITMADVEVLQHAPLIYQMRNGCKEAIAGSYIILNGNDVAFEVAEYDRTRNLIIDPVLAYSTYVGGAFVDEIRSIAVDGSNNLYFTGQSQSSDFPITSGAYNTTNRFGAYVAKMNSAGTALIYSTFFGSRYTNQESFGLAVNGSGEAYVTGYVAGYSATGDFPTTAGAIQSTLQQYQGDDIFVSKFSADGSSLLYSTLLGGNNQDIANAIAVDNSGNAYITGYTRSSNYPTTIGAFQSTFVGAAYNCFVAKINPSGNGSADLIYSTLLAGSASGFRSMGNSITVDSGGNAFIAGTTTYSDFPVVNAFQSTFGSSSTSEEDVFVTKLNATGTGLIYSSFLGGSSSELATGIAIDSSGSAYVTGNTFSPNFPLVGALLGASTGNSVPFVSKISPSGTTIIYSKCIGTGNGGGDTSNAIALDSSGDAVIVGTANSADFPLKCAIQKSNFGRAAFVTKLNGNGDALTFSSYLGANNDQALGVAVATDGKIYIAGITHSTQMPTINALQPTYGGDPSDGFITKIDINAPAAYPQSINMRPNQSKDITLSGSDVQNDPLVFVVTVAPLHGIVAGSPPNITYTANANYVGQDSFTFKANDGSLNSNPTLISISVVNSAPVVAPQSYTMHFGIPKSLTLTGTDVDNDPLIFSLVSQPLHGQLTGTTPNLIYTADVGYVGNDSFFFKANDGAQDSALGVISFNITNIAPSVVNSASSTSVSPNAIITFSAFGNDDDGDGLTYAWQFGDNTTSTNQSPSHAYTEVGEYLATVTVTDPAGVTASANIEILGRPQSLWTKLKRM